jgi:hypothetical protein
MIGGCNGGDGGIGGGSIEDIVGSHINVFSLCM